VIHPLLAAMNTTLEEPLKVQSVRGILGDFNPIAHAKGQLRAGYIRLSENNTPSKTAYSVAGHYHINSKRWHGLKLETALYTVLNLKPHQSPLTLHNDFFDDQGNSFLLFSKLFINGKWGETELSLGRQAMEIPHVDSDDIHMMANFFETYSISNTDITNLTLNAGYINKMAGWGNEGDASRFIDIGYTLGVGESIDGLYYSSAVYEGLKNTSLNLWHYHYPDIANILYAEVGYRYHPSKHSTLTLGAQYDSAKETGSSLLGKQDSHTYGVSLKAEFPTKGLTILTAYNKEKGETGATTLSLGSDPFFSSLEELSIDSLETTGQGWMFGSSYDFKHFNLPNLKLGIAYGSFTASDKTLYDATELDAVIRYSLNDTLFITAIFSEVKLKTNPQDDYKHFSIISNYNF